MELISETLSQNIRKQYHLVLNLFAENKDKTGIKKLS